MIRNEDCMEVVTPSSSGEVFTSPTQHSRVHVLNLSLQSRYTGLSFRKAMLFANDGIRRKFA